MNDTVSVLDGSTFVTSDDRGDIAGTPANPHGLFALDTRFLSRFCLTADGNRLAPLSTDDQSYNAAQFFLAITTGSTYIDSPLSLVRRRSVTTDRMHEEIAIENHGPEARTVELRLEVEADFADLFEVKDALAKKGELYRRVETGRLVLGYKRDQYVRETWIAVSDGEPTINEEGITFTASLAPNGTWRTIIDVWPVVDTLTMQPSMSPADAGAVEAKRPAPWSQPPPRLFSDWTPLEATYARSLTDLEALRLQLPLRPNSVIPAAGLPWFMSVFGRDSLLTSFQALPFVPDLAAQTLRILADMQGKQVDNFRDEEPGKILHELRFGELTAFEERPHSPYYGAADSTMLWLILLDEYERWSGAVDLVRELEPNARAALAWIDEYGDRDGDGYVEYERRNQETGLENQCWKDSWDSIRFADGRLASLPRATCELQGYVYDAKRRAARLAREIWGDPELATRLDEEAQALRERFNRDFWIEARGYFALGLDGEKQQIDALTSNIGHLLWSGIVDDDKAARCVEHLMGDRLFSGWGVRTMAEGDGAYNPIGYHVGTVWPHDNSIIAMGLRRYGYGVEAARIAGAILDAATFFRGRLPEAFAGYPRSLTHYPVEYPTACSPQAWSTGAPLLLLRSLLGLQPRGALLDIDPVLPTNIREVGLVGIPGRWGTEDISVDARAAQRAAVAAIAVTAPTPIREIVARLGDPLREPELKSMHNTVCFVMTDEGAPWYLDIDGRLKGLASEHRDADCTVETASETMVALLEGRLNPRTAVLSGQVRVQGDIQLAGHMVRVLVGRVDQAA